MTGKDKRLTNKQRNLRMAALEHQCDRFAKTLMAQDEIQRGVLELLYEKIHALSSATILMPGARDTLEMCQRIVRILKCEERPPSVNGSCNACGDTIEITGMDRHGAKAKDGQPAKILCQECSVLAQEADAAWRELTAERRAELQEEHLFAVRYDYDIGRIPREAMEAIIAANESTQEDPNADDSKESTPQDS